MTLRLAELPTQFHGRGTSADFGRHGTFDERADAFGDAVFARVRHRLGRDPQELCHHLLAAAAFERRMTGDRREQGGTEAVHIGGGTRRLARDNLGAVNAGEPVTTPAVVSNPPAM